MNGVGGFVNPRDRAATIVTVQVDAPDAWEAHPGTSLVELGSRSPEKAPSHFSSGFVGGGVPPLQISLFLQEPEGRLEENR